MTSHIKNLLVPESGPAWLKQFYDPSLALLMRKRTWRTLFVQQIAPHADERILDLGCGTGTLTIMLQQACPQAEVIGVDTDRHALRIARARSNSVGLPISFWHGRAGDPLNVPMLRLASFDKIVSGLHFHRLTTEQKPRVLEDAKSLLRRGGEMHIADWGTPVNILTRLLFHSMQAIDGYFNTSDNVRGRLPEFMREVGFSGATETHREAKMLGTLCFYRGNKQ